MQSWPTSCTINLSHNVLKIWIMRTQGNAIKVISASLEQQWTVSLFELSAMSQKEESLVCTLLVDLTKAINPHKESSFRQASNYYQLLAYIFKHMPKIIYSCLIGCWTNATGLVWVSWRLPVAFIQHLNRTWPRWLRISNGILLS